MRKYICLAIVLVCVASKKKISVKEKGIKDARIIKNWKLNGLHEVDLKKDEVETRSSSIFKLNYWPGGVVPYRISDTICESKQYIIRRAMDEIEEKSCVRFRPFKTGDVNYIHIDTETGGCWSYTGCKGGQQPMHVKRKCARHGYMLHILVHALGYLNHPQNAYNRDDYIKIHLENMDKGYHDQFDKKNITEYGLPYDYQSIMHYQPYVYSNNKKPTMTPLKEGAEIGHNNSMLSEIDVKTINLMYNCSKVKPCVTTTTKTTTSKLPDTKEKALWGSKIYVFL